MIQFSVDFSVAKRELPIRALTLQASCILSLHAGAWEGTALPLCTFLTTAQQYVWKRSMTVH